MKKFSNNFKQYLVVASLILTAFLVSCSEDSTTPVDDNWSSLKIAVFSDPHFYDLTLGTTGEAFEAYLMADRKLLRESNALMESMINNLLVEKPDVVIVSGDLTKDGELKSHQALVPWLKKLTDKGIKVVVMPGNHDINNPEAASYSGPNTSKVPSVSAAEFQTIYKDYGYSNTISKDPNSLSYVSEPKSGLWIMSIDASRYAENTTSALVNGKLSDATLTWVKARLAEAKTMNKTVIGVMHQGALEHFPGQSVVFADYIINDYQSISTQLAEAGLKIVLTGHFHANDIVKKEVNGKFIYDIETGSLVSFPSPYRILSLSKDGKLNVSTKHITNINYNLDGAKDFQTYAFTTISNGIVPTVGYILKYGFGVPDAMIPTLVPYVVKAMMAHYAGDETIDAESAAFIQNLQKDPSTKPLGDAIMGLWFDYAPKDNNIMIDLSTGVATY